MTDELLRSMTEEEIRHRFRCAPAYYLQSKLDRKRALARADAGTAEDGTTDAGTPPGKGARAKSRRRSRTRRRASARTPAPAPSNPAESKRTSQARAPAGAPMPDLPPASEPAEEPVSLFAVDSASLPSPEGLDLALPGWEILEAALSDFEHFDPTVGPAGDSLTQHEILEAALEDYGNWPFVSGSRDDARADDGGETSSDSYWVTDSGSDLDFAVDPEQATEPDSRLDALLQQVLDAEPEISLVLDSNPELERALDAETLERAENVTRGDFGQPGPGRVRVVMDRKRPNMVRILAERTRLAG